MLILCGTVFVATGAFAQTCSRDWKAVDELSLYPDRHDGFLYVPPGQDTLAWWFDYERSYRTTDEGRSWEAVRQNEWVDSCASDDTRWYYGFNHPLSIASAGKDILYLEMVGAFRLTTDGGRTWQTVEDSLTSRPGTYSFVSFPQGDSVGYWLKLRAYRSAECVIYKTLDAGRSWHPLALIDTLDQFYFRDDSTGLAIGPHAYYRTSDGGKTWVKTAHSFWPFPPRPNYAWLYNGVIVDDKHAWAIPQDVLFQKDDSLWGTSDGGASWHPLVSARESGLVDGSRRFSSEGMSGPYPIDTSRAIAYVGGRLFRTTDGCRSWHQMKTGIRHRSPDGSLGDVQDDMTRPDYDEFGPGFLWIHNRDTITTTRGWYTTDGGDHWYYRYGNAVPISGVGRTGYRASFVDDCWGWVAGWPFLLLSTRDGGATWKESWVPEGRTGAYCVQFVNRRSGWMAFDSGVILHTTTGGKTWVRRDLPIPYNVLKIQFVSERTGFAGDGNAALWKTVDEGQTWTRIIRGPSNPDSLFDGGRIYEIFDFATPTVGYVYNTLAILKTTDGGQTWDTLPYPTNIPGTIDHFMFVDANNGWVETYDMQYYRTRDGGHTWVYVTSNPGVDEGYGIMLATDTATIWGNCLSTDGGRTFRKLPYWVCAARGARAAWAFSPTGLMQWRADSSSGCPAWSGSEITPSLRALEFDSVRIGVDGHRTLYLLNTGTALLRMLFTRYENPHDTTHFTIAGPVPPTIAPGDSAAIGIDFSPDSAGEFTNAFLFSSDDALEPVLRVSVHGVGTRISAVKNAPQSPIENDLVRIYPNPSTSGLTIRLSTPVHGGTLRIYSPLGVCVADLTEQLAHGHRSVTLDERSLAAGVYSCVLERTATRVARTVVIVR